MTTFLKSAKSPSPASEKTHRGRLRVSCLTVNLAHRHIPFFVFTYNVCAICAGNAELRPRTKEGECVFQKTSQHFANGCHHRPRPWRINSRSTGNKPKGHGILLSLCITSRISMTPSDCDSLSAPTFSMDPACDTFYQTYRRCERSDSVEDILKRLDFHPLSITLLATVAHQNKWDTNGLSESGSFRNNQDKLHAK